MAAKLENKNHKTHPVAAKGSAAPDAPVYDFSVLRVLRKQAGLTLQDVTDRSGVSLAVISKLERNLNQAEIDTLFRLARVFGLTASELLNLAESRTAHRIDEDSYQSGDIFFRRITYANMIMFKGRAPAGASTTRPEAHDDVYELCWVLSGKMRLTLPEEVHELPAGAALQFDGVLVHTYEALEDSRFLLVHLKKTKRF